MSESGLDWFPRVGSSNVVTMRDGKKGTHEVPLGGLRLIRKRRSEFVSVNPQSVALFRLGEQCNNDCPMCSNSGRAEAFFIKTPELLRRVDHLRELAFKRVVVTGGEPTIHPGFWDVVRALQDAGIRWDINTHGRTFHAAELAARARDLGLERAIVSLHSHLVEASCLISGQPERGHWETIDGIKNLVHEGVRVMVNCVLTRHNVDTLTDYLAYAMDTFGASVKVKFVFPSTMGKGGDWDGIQLRLSDVQDEIRALNQMAENQGVAVGFESIPPCVLGDATSKNVSRSGFGETHYLEDVHGELIYSIRHIESLFGLYPDTCKPCDAFKNCPGVSRAYLEAWGSGELTPFVQENEHGKG
jgi:MoaA/NifB/PqqE/SkfB family radical SAM enzyme